MNEMKYVVMEENECRWKDDDGDDEDDDYGGGVGGGGECDGDDDDIAVANGIESNLVTLEENITLMLKHENIYANGDLPKGLKITTQTCNQNMKKLYKQLRSHGTLVIRCTIKRHI